MLIECCFVTSKRSAITVWFKDFIQVFVDLIFKEIQLTVVSTYSGKVLLQFRDMHHCMIIGLFFIEIIN